MIVDLNKVSKPSKIQPQIFKIFRDMQKKKDDYLVVIDSNNSPMGVIVNPDIFEKYLEYAKAEESDMKNFHKLSEESLGFWENKKDDVYEDHYNKSTK